MYHLLHCFSVFTRWALAFLRRHLRVTFPYNLAFLLCTRHASQKKVFGSIFLGAFSVKAGTKWDLHISGLHGWKYYVLVWENDGFSHLLITCNSHICCLLWKFDAIPTIFTMLFTTRCGIVGGCLYECMRLIFFFACVCVYAYVCACVSHRPKKMEL